MAVQFKDRWEIQATLVANEFIDTYMAQANGEYVKVYLYLLRHQREEVTVEAIASALDHTESDVKRALAYWKKKGILENSEAEREYESGAETGTEYSQNGAGLYGRETEYEELTKKEPSPVYSAGQVQRLSGDEEFSPVSYTHLV